MYSGTVGVVDIVGFYKTKFSTTDLPQGYYRVKIAVQNSTGGGCSSWDEKVVLVNVTCQNVVVAYTINNDISNTVNVNRGDFIWINPYSTTGETMFSYEVQELNAAGVPIGTIYGQNVWQNGKSPMIRLDYYFGQLGAPWGFLSGNYYQVTLKVKNPQTSGSCLYSLTKRINFCSNCRSAVSSIEPNLPLTAYIYPNPVDSKCTLLLQLPSSGGLSVKVYNITGTEVMNICENKDIEAGVYELSVSSEGLMSGIYFLHIYIGNQYEIIKFIKR